MRALVVGLLMLIPLAHGESEPSDAAIAYLIKVARERVDTEKDTALADGTTVEKEKIIREHLKRLSSIVDEGELRAIDERVEGELAAVLVSRIIDYDPSQVQVFALAMLKREDRWLPAPVLGSFENTGITYLPKLSRTSKELETWMLNQRIIQLTRLRDDVQTGLLDDIRKTGSLDEIRTFPPEQIVTRFIDACRAGNLPAALAYLGGLEKTLPKNWDDILQFVSSNLRGNRDPNESWRQLVNPSGARAVIETDLFTDGAMVSLGEFAPLESIPGQPAITVFHFPLERTKEGIWRLRLPSWLLDGVLPDEADPSDAELIQAFPAKLLEQHPAATRYSDPTALMESFQQALSSPRFESILPFIALPESGDALLLLERASFLWRDFRSRKSQAPLLLEVHQQDDQACALLSLFDARNPQIRRSLIKRIHLQRKDDHWMIPCSSEAPNTTSPELIVWAEKTSGLSESEWFSRLGLATTIGSIPADSAPSEAEALAAANAWLEAVRSRDPRAILRTVATFDDKRGIKNLFRAIGHELQDGHRSEVLKIHRHGRWAAVSTHAASAQRSADPYLLLYPIVSTQSGPRVLAAALLFHADTRSLEFLNSDVWSRLEERLPEAAITELKEIQKAHSSLAESP